MPLLDQNIQFREQKRNISCSRNFLLKTWLCVQEVDSDGKSDKQKCLISLRKLIQVATPHVQK